ncbi:PAS domain-containing protein [Alkalimonas amylolytica]|uniref:PAS fold n=1 Tax=Alkalimonas amylolytica TaxID=152573 RepID=A0A1H3ZJD1_ALKAM|nr:PAS domain-containing protein [Alkalimonas amylolytica]SEA23795.1 PAS fold [Alkalimonas amylolytica]
MPHSMDPPQVMAPLRQQAEQKLRAGTMQLSKDFTASADALSVLYRLSSQANTASDSLKLLHELQIHQVELDLQLEQLQHNERESNHQLACYQHFFSQAPVGCFIASLDGIITECNAVATSLFAHQTTPIPGRSLELLFAASCRPMLSATLARVRRNQQPATLLVTTADGTSQPEKLRLTIHVSPDHNAMLLMLAADPMSRPAQLPATEQL